MRINSIRRELEALKWEWIRHGSATQDRTMRYKLLEEKLANLTNIMGPEELQLKLDIRFQARLEWAHGIVPHEVSEYLKSP